MAVPSFLSGRWKNSGTHQISQHPGDHPRSPLTQLQLAPRPPLLWQWFPPHIASAQPADRSHTGKGTHQSVESQSDNGIDPDDTALHLSPHRKDALRVLPFPVPPAGKDSRPHTLRRYLSQRHSARCRSPRLRGKAGHQYHTVTDQRIQRGRFRNQPGDRAGHRREGQASDVSVRQPALLPVSLVPGGHQADGEHGGRSGQAFSPFCGISTRLHGRVVTQPASSRHNGVR